MTGKTGIEEERTEEMQEYLQEISRQIKFIKGMDSGRTCFGGCFFVPNSHIIFEKMHRINKKGNDNASAEKESKWISKR